MTTLDRLQRARDGVAKVWTQDSDACLVTWLFHQPCATPDDVKAINGAVALCRDLIGSPLLAIWNDTPGRTREDVLCLLDCAIAIEQAKHADYQVEVATWVC